MRGLKLQRLAFDKNADLSHPTWVRGLKHRASPSLADGTFVAPYVGAWIETVGLPPNPQDLQCRTLRGCVD